MYVGGTVRSSVPFVLYPNILCSGMSSPIQKKCCDWFSVPGHVGGIPPPNLMLEEEGPSNTVFQQDGAPHLYFHIAVLRSKLSTEMD